MSDTPRKPYLVAIDDGYAQTKLYGEGPDGKIIKTVNRSSVRNGRYGVGDINGEGFVGLYETEDGPYTVSEDVESENTQFDNFHTSTMNRALVFHALVSAEDHIYGGHNINLITGLPVADYFQNGFRDEDKIAAKRANLLKPIHMMPQSAAEPIISEVFVGCQAVAAWVDFALDENNNIREVAGDGDVAIVDIGGRTTDIATVIGGNSVDHQRSGTANIGVLDVYRDVNKAISTEFKLRDEMKIKVLDRAVRTGQIKLWNKMRDVTHIVASVIAEYENKIAREVERKIGRGATMNAVAFVGGGSSLFQNVASNFPNGEIVKDPEFANARGLFKFYNLKLKA